MTTLMPPESFESRRGENLPADQMFRKAIKACQDSGNAEAALRIWFEKIESIGLELTVLDLRAVRDYATSTNQVEAYRSWAKQLAEFSPHVRIELEELDIGEESTK
ncbi:MAG: hypothetical protein ACI8UO_003985 [Verrucomicrobiales bacterium]|jgi:hypothetical protein